MPTAPSCLAENLKGALLAHRQAAGGWRIQSSLFRVAGFIALVSKKPVFFWICIDYWRLDAATTKGFYQLHAWMNLLTFFGKQMWVRHWMLCGDIGKYRSKMRTRTELQLHLTLAIISTFVCRLASKFRLIRSNSH